MAKKKVKKLKNKSTTIQIRAATHRYLRDLRDSLREETGARMTMDDAILAVIDRFGA